MHYFETNQEVFHLSIHSLLIFNRRRPTITCHFLISRNTAVMCNLKTFKTDKNIFIILAINVIIIVIIFIVIFIFEGFRTKECSWC